MSTMERDVKGKVVVITGAAEGIGYEMVKNFLEKGAKIVIILDINEEKGQAAIKTLNEQYGDGTNKRAVFILCNVATDLESVSQTIFDNFKVDVLINNAGILDEQSFERTIDINLTAVIAWTEKLYNYMRKDKGGNGGTILNVSSIYGYRVMPHAPFYQASKFGVLGYSKSLGNAFNYDRTGVRVVALCPGLTTTSMSTRAEGREPNLKEEFIKHLEDYEWQTSDAMGRGTVHVFERADSGSAWLVEGSRDAVEI